MKVMGFIESQRMLNEMWQVYKKYSVQDLTNDELELLAQLVEKIYEKYKAPFAKDIAVAFLNEIGRSVRFMRVKR